MIGNRSLMDRDKVTVKIKARIKDAEILEV